MTDHLKILMKTLEQRRMRTALAIDPETGEETPVLVRVVIAGTHKLIHPMNFIERLGEDEQFIDPGTLEILGLDDIPTDEDWKKWGITQEMLDAKRAEAGEQAPAMDDPIDKPEPPKDKKEKKEKKDKKDKDEPPLENPVEPPVDAPTSEEVPPEQAPPAEGTIPPDEEILCNECKQPQKSCVCAEPKPNEEPPASGDIPVTVWSEKELKVIGNSEGGYDKLRSISKLYDDIPGNISKVKLITKISGRAKP